MLPLHQGETAVDKLVARQKSQLLHSVRKRARVVYIINDLSIGGAEMMLYKLLAETDLRRYEPIVISLIDRGGLRERIEKLGITVHTVGMKPGMPSPLGLFRLVKLMRRLKPHLVIGWMYHSCLAAQLANFFLSKRAPILWSIHYSVSSLASEKRLTAAVIKACAFLSKLPEQIIFVSRASQAQHKPLGYRSANACVIPNGINISEFVPSRAARLSVRAELKLSDDALLIGLAGRYHPMKDHSNFLQAASMIAREHPAAHFVLVGRGVDQDNRALIRQIADLGLLGQTHLLGERHDMARLSAALDIFTLSSAYGESFPNVIGEAMACEVSPVVTEVGDAVWIVGKAGCTVPPRDPAALASAWREMIALGPEGRARLGKAARSRVMEYFPLESVVARYHDLYQSVLAEKTPDSIVELKPLAGLPNLGASLDDNAIGDSRSHSY